MTDAPIKIETDETGIILSQACPSPEWSITGEGGRTDMVLITDAELPAVAQVIKQRMNEIHERNSL
ncbi:hypothetical protein ACVIRO_002375 [Rhizobium ruizarguesonis]